MKIHNGLYQKYLDQKTNVKIVYVSPYDNNKYLKATGVIIHTTNDRILVSPNNEDVVSIPIEKIISIDIIRGEPRSEIRDGDIKEAAE